MKPTPFTVTDSTGTSRTRSSIGPVSRAFQPQFAVVAMLAAATIIQLPALLSPFSGGFHDDGIYLVTARALAEGRGYVIDSLPQRLEQTKYPVVFPAVLAALWKVYPDFPDNLPLLRLVPLLALWAWLWLVWKVIGEELKRTEAALWIVALTLASPMTIYLGTQLLSETLFAAVATWAILLMVRIHRSHEPATVRRIVVLALACAIAFNTRTIGIALIPAAAWVLGARRDVRAIAIFVIVAAAGYLPWILWQAAHEMAASAHLAYYTKANYGGWNLITGGDLTQAAGVIALNATFLVAAPAVLWAVPSLPFQLLLYLALFAAAVWGCTRMINGSAAAGAIWVAGTMGILLLWAWPPVRFLIPILPFILLGLLHIAPQVKTPVTLNAARLACVMLISTGVAQSARLAAGTMLSDLPPSFFQTTGATTTELTQGMAWVRANTPDDAVIAANLDANYWLYADRIAVRAFAADPAHLFYSADAPAGALGNADALRGVLMNHGVSYLIVENLPHFRELEPLQRQIAEFEATWPDALSEVWRSAGSGVVIYQVVW